VGFFCPQINLRRTSKQCKKPIFAQKKPAERRGFSARLDQLLDLAFLVDHVLTDSWIEFFNFELIRGGAFVLVGGVEVTGTGT
jgi:hypothetical protein